MMFVPTMYVLLKASGKMLHLISPVTLSFSCMTMISSKLMPNRVASISLLMVPDKFPRNKTNEHYSMRRNVFTSLCQLASGMNEIAWNDFCSAIK